MINKDLLNILACPVCKVEVRLEDDWIVCTQCGRKYPIRDDIPVMLVEEAEVPEGLEEEEDDLLSDSAGDE